MVFAVRYSWKEEVCAKLKIPNSHNYLLSYREELFSPIVYGTSSWSE